MTVKKPADAVRYDARSFIIRGKRELLIGGEFHYFRTPRELWEDRIIKIKDSGSNLITTYIPWSWHEPREGQEQWEGDHDLVHFIKLCTKHGMFLIVKPGPYCCAELDFGGHPDWLLSKKIPLRVLDNRYLKYVEKWYKRMAEVIKPYLVTNGGNIFSIQVENEYDHLINFGVERIPLKDALAYFAKLMGMMDKGGIDIPKFANEAAFLRGRKGIIDTRTYYPTIPLLPGWQWQLDHYDEKIAHAKKGQPGCPTMILELQIGWFGMHGHHWPKTGLELTEAVSKSSLMSGASVLNYYMMAGGTTFPFWGSRGDIFNLVPRGMGLITSFDFDGSPVREWGELHAQRYEFIKAFNRFATDYQALLLDSDNVDDMKVISGGEQIVVVKPEGVSRDTHLQQFQEKFAVLTRKRGSEYLLCIRNISPVDRVVTIGPEDGKPVFKDLAMKAYTTLILPVNVTIPGTNLTVKRSTSEPLFVKQVGAAVHFGFYGKKGVAKETVLAVPANEVQVVAGDVKISGQNGETVLHYSHHGLQIVKVRNHYLWLVEQALAGKVEPLDHGILVADTYYFKGQSGNGQLTVKTQMRNDSKNTFYYFGERNLASASVEGRSLAVNREGGVASVAYQNPKDQPMAAEWVGDWKIKGDVDPVRPGYKDSSWQLLKKPISLEEAGLLDHGYVWFRGEFEVPAGSQETTMFFPSNDTDRFYIYVNGKRVYNGITGMAEVNIQGAVKKGKNVLTVLYQNFYHTKSHPNEGAIQKYSGIMQPVVIKGKAKGKSFNVKVSAFRVRQQLDGNLNGYTQLNFDDSQWMTVPAAHKYIVDENMGTVVWMRRKFKFSTKPGWECAVKLTIPRAWERCLIYINGHATGWFEGVGPQHDFYVPSTFLQKDNVLALALEAPWQDRCLVEPEIGTFFDAKDVEVKLNLQ